METEKLCKFLDEVIEGAYQARCFQKENVHQVLMMADMIKNKMIHGDKLVTEISEQKNKIEILESENKVYKERFEALDNAVEESQKIINVNEFEVIETEETEISPEDIMAEKLFGSAGTNNLSKNKSTKILQK